MTKEQIENYIDDKKQYGLGSGLKGLTVTDVATLTDKMIQDFESRTCENCKYYHINSIETKFCSYLQLDIEQYTLKYCSKFVSTDIKSQTN